MIARTSGLSRRIFIGSALLAVVMAAAFAVLLSAVLDLRSTSNKARETERVIAVANRVEKLVIDLETGQRGFVITGKPIFLQPFHAATQDLPGAITELERLLAGDAGQLARARRIGAAVREYQHNWANRVVAVARRNPVSARALVATGRGKHRVDRIRGYFDVFLSREQSIADARRSRSAVVGTRAVWIGIAGIIATFVLIFVFATYLRRLVVFPVRRIAQGARSVARGQLETRVPETGAGEAGGLARDFNSMARSLERSAHALERQNAELQAVLDATVDSIVLTDLNGEVVLSNRKMQGFRRDVGLEDEGKIWDRLARFADLTTKPQAYADRFAHLAANPTAAEEFEFEIAQSGRVFVTHTAAVPDSSGTLIGRIFSTREVTSERQSERAKDEFIAIVSHELRTPLTSIRGFLELLLEEEGGPLTDDQRDFLAVIERNADRLLRVVGDLLFVAQAEAGTISMRRGRFDLAQLFQQAVAAARPACQERELVIEYEGPRALEFEGDSDRIAQLVDNLVSNALKFTKPGGRIRVCLLDDDESATLLVSDEGPGISSEDQGRLFDRFFRTDDARQAEVPGTGLGLSIVRAIVDAHDGVVSVQSTVGRGTTFRVTLPRLVAERAA